VTPLLEVESLQIGFASPSGTKMAIHDLSFSIGAGECLALAGESGTGKSVTSLAIMRLLPPSTWIRGSIKFDGIPILDQPPERMRALRGRSIAMVFQEPLTALDPVMTIGAQMVEAVAAHHPSLKRSEMRERALEALSDVTLPNPMQRFGDYPHQFSGGQLQRILMAMAIVNRPKLLIADEPTTALDVTVQAQVLDLLASLRERFNLAMLFISHDLAVIARVADRIGVMRHGRMVECGTRDQVLLNPQQAYTKALLGAVPTMQTPRDRPLATLA
jgi:peptide/nickel transport system ATP-binding protein